MFKTLFSMLSLSPAAADRSNEVSITFGALMIRIAKADADYADEERAVIKARLTPLLKAEDDINNILAQAEALEAISGDTVHLTNKLKALVPLDDRIKLIEGAWAVVLADGARDAHEDALMRLLSKLLGLSDVESAKARSRVSRG